MNRESNFEPKAAVLWASFTPKQKKLILDNVFCANCKGAVVMVDYRGEVDRGDLVLIGKCKNCGREVARFIETSELDSSRN